VLLPQTRDFAAQKLGKPVYSDGPAGEMMSRDCGGIDINILIHSSSRSNSVLHVVDDLPFIGLHFSHQGFWKNSNQFAGTMLQVFDKSHSILFNIDSNSLKKRHSESEMHDRRS
jgi:hypothetical protein